MCILIWYHGKIFPVRQKYLRVLSKTVPFPKKYSYNPVISEINLIKIFPLSEKYLYRYSEWWNDDRVCWLRDTCQCTGRPGSSRQLRLRALPSPAAAAFSARTCSTSPNSCCLLSHIHLYGFKLANFGDWIKNLNNKTPWLPHTQCIKLQFTWLAESRSFAMYLYQCAVTSGALHCFPPPPPPSQLLSPRRGDSPVQRRQGRGAVRRLQSASWSRRCDATLASTIRHRGEPDLIHPWYSPLCPSNVAYVKSLSLSPNCPLLCHQKDRE